LLRPDASDFRRARHWLYCFDPSLWPGEDLMPKQETLVGSIYEDIYDRAPGIIAASTGPNHVFTYANASYCRLVGRRDLVGKRVSDAMPELAAQGVLGLLDEVFRTGEPFVGDRVPMEFHIDGQVGLTRKYVSFIYQPLRGSDGAITGLFCEGYDATIEVIATERLEALQEEFSHAARVNAMGMMAATLAHELNQPLAAISSYANACVRLLDQREPDAAHLTTAMHAIDEAAQRAGNIIRIMRDLTKRGGTTKSEFPLHSVVSESIRLVCAGGCSAGEIAEQVSADLTIYGNRTQILQVLVNLIRNACDAGSKDSNRITVSAWRDDAKVIVSVRDSGRGLSAEAARNVFTWTESNKNGGTGLGLAICRTILDAHHGHIWLEDSGPGGSDFRFLLPGGSAKGGELSDL
jgi:signal transduction histidine kinase